MNERKAFHCDRIAQCSVCGAITECEIHHKRPIAIGGSNGNENLICLCHECHVKAHESNQASLIKAGMRSAAQITPDYLVSFSELWAKIIRLILECDGENIKATDVIDVIDSLDIIKRDRRTTGRKKRTEMLEQATQDLEEYFKDVLECPT